MPKFLLTFCIVCLGGGIRLHFNYASFIFEFLRIVYLHLFNRFERGYEYSFAFFLGLRYLCGI